MTDKTRISRDFAARFNLIGRTDKPVDGRLIVGRTKKNQAIALGDAVDADVLRDMFAEAAQLGITERPMLVFGTTCDTDTPSIRFTQLVAL